MSFLFKSSSSSGNLRKDDGPAPSQSPPLPPTAPKPISHIQGTQLGSRNLSMEGASEPSYGGDSPSVSSQMPTFHTGSYSTGAGLGGGSSMSGFTSGPPLHSRTPGAGSVPGTPPNEFVITRQGSVSSTGSMDNLPLPHPSMLVNKHVTSHGSVHHIYQTNVLHLMTPGSSMPSTPNHNQSHMYALPPVGSEMSLAAASASAAFHMHAPLAQPGASLSISTNSVRSTPGGSPCNSPPLPSTHKLVSSSSAAGTHIPFDMPDAAVATAATPASPLPMDPVSVIRRMFRAPGLVLSRSIFTLGDTLGTGTFGRVRIVTFHPPAEDGSGRTGKPLYLALKMLKKSEIIRLKQVEHIKAEKSILSRIAHPFIVNLYTAFQDERYLYMTMEYVIGGELFSQLRRVGRFSNDTARFYAAEIILALSYLHAQNICYRDLKPENLLLDAEGHIKITDFGFAKVVEDRTWTLCGTPEYLAPEIIQSKGHGKAVDWWALGILIFEMLAGYPPFYDENPFGIYQKILKGVIDFPRHMDPNAKDLIKKLLTADRTKRWGCLKDGVEDIKNHAWFRGVHWQNMLARAVKPPFVPAYRAPNDTSNFDRYPDSREGSMVAQLGEKEKMLFADF